MKNITLMTTKLNKEQNLSTVMHGSWFSWDVASFLEGKTGGLYSMRLCTKYRQESAKR